MDASNLSVTNLAKLGNTPHRVEWFGEVIRSGSQHLARITFSPWGLDDSSGEFRSHPAKAVDVPVPIAYLRLFRIGDIWAAGRNTGRCDVPTRETFHLDIHEGVAKVMPSGVPMNDNLRFPEYPLPFSVFSAHRNHTQSQCVRVQIDAQSMLVVPCMELVRFYFGASGAFLKRLFSGAFALDKLYTNARRNPETRTVNVDLAVDLPGAAAATVARIAFDAHARSAAAWIVNSATVSSANKDRYYPKTTFPFHGETDLTADGRWIDHDGVRVFLAERLVQCTHPFPFDTLFYTTCKSPMDPRKLFGTLREESTHDATRDPPVTDMQLDEQSASSTLQPVGIPIGIEVGEPFPDLTAKKIRRVKPKSWQGPPSPRIEEATELAAGAETSTSDLRSAEVMADESFDETSVEELPTEAVDMFNEAFGAFSAASRGTYSLAPPLLGATSDALRPGPFLRADAVCPAGDKCLEYVWCALLRTADDAATCSLVLIRDNVDRDRDDHLVLVRINNAANPQSEIQSYCREFAHGQHSEQITRNLLLMCGTTVATDMFGVLRGLSGAVGNLLYGRIEVIGPPVTRREELSRPIMSAAVLGDLLEKARIR